MTSNIGRRSSFSKEQQDFIADSKNHKKEIIFRAIIVDVCSYAKSTSKFIKNKSFKNGITLIIVPYENCEIYAVGWKGDEASLRGLAGGTDENIIGREISVKTKSRRSFDMFDADLSFNGQKIREVQNTSAPGYRSMSFYASMYTDYESQMLNNKRSLNGIGEIPIQIEQ